jgi:hypothetical protein
MKLQSNFMFRLITPATLALCLLTPSHAAARTINAHSLRTLSLARNQRAIRIPFEIYEDGHIFLRVNVNGSEPLLFGLDSGMEQTTISQQLATALKLKLRGGMQATGGGEGTVDFALARNVSFNLPGIKFVLREVGVIPLDFPSPVPGQAIAGILGYDFISRFVVELDYTPHTMTLYNPRSYRYRGRGEIIPISMLDNNPYIPAKVVLPGLAPLKGMFVIDSGAANELFFNSPFVIKRKLLHSTQETTEASSLGIGGTSKIRIGRATSVQFGKAIINNPGVQFSQAAKGDDASAIGAGAIGGKLLRQFKTVIFDQYRRRLILEPSTQKD